MRSYIKSGYTLIEILVAVTLMMLLMLGVTSLFSSIGSSLNDTQSTLALTTKIRGVKTRLAKDLTMLTVDPSQTPPVKFGTSQGYLCIIEGMGAGYDRITKDSNGNQIAIWNASPFSTSDIACNPESVDNPYDNTVGDTDDVIMFTARAPAGEPFRGRLNGQVIESDTAEIVWFVRGNVLYRRVLLVVPDSELTYRNPIGFYTVNDVSARPYYNQNTNTLTMLANSLDDLGRRENRFAHSAFDSENYAKLFTDSQSNNGPNYFMARFPFPVHKNSACYFLRMPTMTETSHMDWNAAYSFAGNLDNPENRANDAIVRNNPSPELMYRRPVDDTNLSENLEDGILSSELPRKDEPFIDYWSRGTVASPWENDRSTTDAKTSNNAEVLAVDRLTGNVIRFIDITVNRSAEDVMLTNVLSFDVQVWNPESLKWINLGDPDSVGVLSGYVENQLSGESNADYQKRLLKRYGNYANKNETNTNLNTNIPCVYDTWTDYYESAVWDPTGAIRVGAGKDQLDNNGNGVVDDIDEWECPPPYSVGLKGVKITIRAFDRASNNVREMTIIQNFGK